MCRMVQEAHGWYRAENSLQRQRLRLRRLHRRAFRFQMAQLLVLNHPFREFLFFHPLQKQDLKRIVFDHVLTNTDRMGIRFFVRIFKGRPPWLGGCPTIARFGFVDFDDRHRRGSILAFWNRQTWLFQTEKDRLWLPLCSLKRARWQVF